MQLSTKHLLGIKDLQLRDIELILSTATQFKEVLQRPIKKVPSLRDTTIVNLFYENSTRTRISFELAEKRLSADTLNFTASGSSVSKGETLLDPVINILSMKVDMVVMRHSGNGAPHFLAKHIVILHPGPVNRGLEIDSDVDDSKQSIILQQVENGVAVRMAVLYLLSNKQNFN